MTIKELKNKMLEARRLDEPSFTMLELDMAVLQAQNDKEITYDLQDIIEYLLGICITDINSTTNDSYYIQVDYYSKSLKKNIILDTDLFLGTSPNEFYKILIDLSDEMSSIEEKLQDIQ